VESDDPAVQEMIEFLKDDLNNLFNDKGIDQSRYGEVVDFEDPITKYNSLDGYLFNIKMLRYVFNPEFILHGIWQSGPNEITSRWTMNMELSVNRANPFRKFWDPKLTFTGLSVYTMDEASRKIVRHVDYWDAIENQKYLSLEAVGHLISQLTDVTRTPELEGPRYTVLKKMGRYEVRRYKPYLVAEREMAAEGAALPPQPEERRGAFRALAGYIFGSNREGRKMAMTTPVLSDSRSMQFVINGFESSADAPSPNDSTVTVKECPGGVFAALRFSGRASEEEAQEKQGELRRMLAADGYVAGDGFMTARYNDPSVQAAFRRNEVLVPVEGFKLLEVDA